jgi:hypothetical protein
MTEGLHRCLFCGEPVAPDGVDPLTAVISVAPRSGSDPEAAADRPARRRPGPRWWQQPPGQYWMHSACLRRHAHASTRLEFLDITEPRPRER